MKQFSTPISICCFGLIVFLFSGPAAIAAKPDSVYVSIEELMNNKQLSGTIKGKGGYQAECIEFDLKNLTRDTLFIELEPGRRLVSKDTAEQDILIVKRRRFSLAPLAALVFSGFGFCCESRRHAPAAQSDFSVGYMAPPEWQKLTNLIDQNNFPNSAIQSAIWCISDNHDLSSIHDEDQGKIRSLKRTVAMIKGMEVPWYSVTYETEPGTLFSGKAESVYGEVTYYLSNNALVSINVRDKNGVVVANLEKGTAKGSGEYTYPLALSVKGWPKGEYEIAVYEDYSRLIKRVKFIL
ncbi:MAG TPA: hypothetical protein VK151_18145 [Fluviicola sp.]|nr:hypothetical protein [Fluviicola sp.]